MTKKAILASSLIAVLALGSNCQLADRTPTAPDSGSDDPTDFAPDLDSPTGGFTLTDELPAFGEPELFDDFLNEETVTDGYGNGPVEAELRPDISARTFRFRAVWGNLEAAFVSDGEVPCCPTMWAGALHMEGGVLLVERVIAFDPGDQLVRVDRSTIEWSSNTCPHVDGVQVRLIVPDEPVGDGSLSAVPSLTLRTGPFSRTFTLEELVALDMFERVDECGNGISIGSHAVEPDCPHGQLMGRWTRTDLSIDPALENAEAGRVVLGVFHGVWIGAGGRPAGHLRGVFGLNSEGERVFFGKYVDLGGRFRGILRGEYGPSPEISPELARQCGWFRGDWIGVNRVAEGQLRGRWITNALGLGFFHGVWGMNCSRVM